MSPYTLRRSTASITYASATLPSRARQPRQLRLEEPANLVVGQTTLAKLLDCARNDRLAGTKRVGRLFPAGSSGHERSGAVAEFDHALVLELAIRLCDGVRVDDELFGEGTDTGELLARAQSASFDGVLHLLHQLEVDRHAERRIGTK